jgi:2-polyprenyl-6-methoxyphenol hydroxylase-like FAD-dependent oxidoreductase
MTAFSFHALIILIAKIINHGGSQMLPNAKRALIIGGGVAGPVLALFLRRAGFAPEIFEATTSPTAAGGALGLAPNGMNVLAAANLVEQVRDASVTAGEWLFENQAGKVLASSPGGDPARYGQPTAMITRPDLHRVLLAQAQEEGIPIHFDKSFASLNDTPGKSVVAQFSDGSSAEGDFVVGADGIRSQVRQAIMPTAPKPVYTGMMAPGGFSPSLDSNMRPRSNQRVHFIFGQNGFFGYFNAITVDGPRTAWWSTASAPLPNKEQMGPAGQAELRRRLMELHGQWAEPVPQLIESAETMLNIAIHDVPSLPSWSVGRTILIGDAAHAVAPHSGQGASMALEDAHFLARLLRDSQGVALDRMFADFERQRRPRTDKVIALGRRNAQRKEMMSPVAYWIQQQMIRIFVPLTPARRQHWLLTYRVE